METNKFYHGDCLFVLQHDIEPESIDLIYLDPPFFTGKVQKGEDKWNPEAMEISYNDTKAYWGQHQKRMREKAPLWLNSIPRENEFKSYIYYMMERLEACKIVLKKTGSIYLHCDWRTSHYLKMVMDEIFSSDNFLNEIIWAYKSGGVSKRYFARKHDTIFLYSKTPKYYFNQQKERTYKYGGIGKSSLQKYFKDDNDDEYCLVAQTDVFSDIGIISTHNKIERSGYPTQKPLALLNRIIETSSDKGDLVLDPFCGCGTTIIAANNLGRRWIGIDISKDALDVTKGRETQMTLEQMKQFTNAEYVSRDLNKINNMNPSEFEAWVNQYYKATKPMPDKGVDGVTQKGIAIQTKTYLVKYEKLSGFLTNAMHHHATTKPVKEIIMVSQVGFGEDTEQLKFKIENTDHVKVHLETPKTLLGIN